MVINLSLDAARALVEFWASIAQTMSGVLALAIIALVAQRRLRLGLGSPWRAIRRAAIRARWSSVARSSSLAVSKDRRPRLALTTGSGPSLWSVLDGSAMSATPSRTSSTTAPKPVERLPRISRGRASPDKLTVTYRLTPARGQTVEDIANHAGQLADALKVRRAVVRRTGPNRGELTLYLADVFRLPRAWMPATMPSAIPWGHDEHGAVTSFPLGQGHALAAGATGSGKSGFLDGLVASASIRDDLALVGVDLKKVELGPWRARFTDVAVEPAQAAALIADVADEVRRRFTLLEAAGLRKMTSPADIGVPWVLVVIDELSELLDSIDKGDIISIGRLARACGISLVVFTQRPTAKTLSADLRDQLDVMRWCGRVPPSSTTGEMVLGDAVKVLDPSTIDRSTKAVGVLDDADGVRLARPDWLDDPDVKRVAAQTAHLRIPVEVVFPNRQAVAA